MVAAARNANAIIAWTLAPLAILGSGTLWTGAATRGEWLLPPIAAIAIAGLAAYAATTLTPLGPAIGKLDKRAASTATALLALAGIILWTLTPAHTIVDTWWTLGATLYGTQWRAGLTLLALALAAATLLLPPEPDNATIFQGRIQ